MALNNFKRCTSQLLFLLTIVLAPSIAMTQNRGNVDSVARDFVTGWACEGSDGRSRWVHIFDGSTYLGSTTSNMVRRDDAAGLCQGKNYVGFNTAVRIGDGAHQIKVYTNDSPYASQTNQLGSTINVNFGNLGTQSPSPLGVIESTSSSSIAGWACDNNAPAGAIQLQVLVQYDGNGDFFQIATGQTSVTRSIPYCLNPVTGFNISLPVLRGGQHNIIVRALNVGAGANNNLAKFSALPTLTPISYEPSANQDANLAQAAGCWVTPGANPAYVDSSSCTGDFLWVMALNQTVNTTGLPAPSLGYSGPATRIRYDGLSGGGMAFKINTYDSATNVYPWDYNFQAMQTRMPGVAVAGASSLITEFRLRPRDDFFFYDKNLTGPLPGIETGNVPWIHTILAGVLLDTSTNITYFIEVVPFYREGPGGSLLGTIGGNSPAYNARLAISDPRLASAISVPSPMLLGETRTVRINFRQAFQNVFPGISLNNIVFTGSYMGTEQYGRDKIAFDFKRLSVQVY